mmetsp:Transcript_8622/g.18541  ORF Transcript_8622/g.18541 Transcript_8622/m.18541 type:complete len:183 (-) Transcript_8622:190-738(-)
MENRAARTGGTFPPYRPAAASSSVRGALPIDSGLAVTYSAGVVDGGASAPAESSDDDGGRNSVPGLREATPSRNGRASGGGGSSSAARDAGGEATIPPQKLPLATSGGVSKDATHCRRRAEESAASPLPWRSRVGSQASLSFVADNDDAGNGEDGVAPPNDGRDGNRENDEGENAATVKKMV